jgi:hypothetical protein
VQIVERVRRLRLSGWRSNWWRFGAGHFRWRVAAEEVAFAASLTNHPPTPDRRAPRFEDGGPRTFRTLMCGDRKPMRIPFSGRGRRGNNRRVDLVALAKNAGILAFPGHHLLDREGGGLWSPTISKGLSGAPRAGPPADACVVEQPCMRLGRR